jgi:hypothetical protein
LCMKAAHPPGTYVLTPSLAMSGHKATTPIDIVQVIRGVSNGS